MPPRPRPRSRRPALGLLAAAGTLLGCCVAVCVASTPDPHPSPPALALFVVNAALAQVNLVAAAASVRDPDAGTAVARGLWLAAALAAVGPAWLVIAEVLTGDDARAVQLGLGARWVTLGAVSAAWAAGLGAIAVGRWRLGAVLFLAAAVGFDFGSVRIPACGATRCRALSRCWALHPAGASMTGLSAAPDAVALGFPGGETARVTPPWGTSWEPYPYEACP